MESSVCSSASVAAGTCRDGIRNRKLFLLLVREQQPDKCWPFLYGWLLNETIWRVWAAKLLNIFAPPPFVLSYSFNNACNTSRVRMCFFSHNSDFSTWNDSVGCYGAHGDGGQHRLWSRDEEEAA